MSEMQMPPSLAQTLISDETQELLVFTCRCAYQSISFDLPRLAYEVAVHMHQRHHDGYRLEDVRVDRFVRA